MNLRTTIKTPILRGRGSLRVGAIVEINGNYGVVAELARDGDRTLAAVTFGPEDDDTVIAIVVRGDDA